jgi:hypothetical protein
MEEKMSTTPVHTEYRAQKESRDRNRYERKCSEHFPFTCRPSETCRLLCGQHDLHAYPPHPPHLQKHSLLHHQISCATPSSTIKSTSRISISTHIHIYIHIYGRCGVEKYLFSWEILECRRWRPTQRRVTISSKVFKLVHFAGSYAFQSLFHKLEQ